MKIKLAPVFEKLSEAIGWLQIAGAFTVIGAIIGAIIYVFFHTPAGLILAICIALLGLVYGIRLANKMWKTKGTIWFLSRVSASPELDEAEEDNGNQS